MKTIEERAKEFAMNKSDMYCGSCDTCSIKCEDYRRYVDIATEQKAIDDAKLLKLKSSWEKEAQINHDNEANYKQGYHDAIENACKWWKNNWREYVYQDGDGIIHFGHWESDFRKATEE